MIGLYIALGIVGGVLVFYVFPNLLVATVLYAKLLVRTSKKKWARNCSWDDEEQIKMFAIGEEWGIEHEKYHSQVSVRSGKYNLVGEYFDFGYDKAVIVVPGRMETCVYSYYFAQPYEKIGYNVLAIDNRSHGLSDGRYNTLGLKEYRDLLEWAKFLHNEKGVSKIWFHGICIGASTALNAFVCDDAPDYLEGLTVDGMYIHFGDMLEKRIRERGHAVHPCLDIVMQEIKVHAGKNPAKNGPIHCIDKMNRPMLFMYSKEDVYSDAESIGAMFEKCGSSKKTIKWFDKGIHSHIRINAEEEYDKTIIDFVKEATNE